MKKIKDLTGNKYGFLTVIKLHASDQPNGQVIWHLKCVCGKDVFRVKPAFKNCPYASCGCKRNSDKIRHRQSGCGGSGVSREYRAWVSIKSRCENPKSKAYNGYGGRGIQICQRWRASFADFLADMGPCPTNKHSIDRRDNDGSYEPDNCRWATRVEQQNNTRRNRIISYKMETKTLAEWCRELNLNYHRARNRLNSGWAAETVFTSNKVINQNL